MMIVIIKTTVPTEREDLSLCLVSRGRAEVAPDGVYEEGQGLILLDEVQCLGTEASLLACTHSEWRQHDCSHSEDVGVRCDRDGDTNEIPRLLPPIGKYTRGRLLTIKGRLLLSFLKLPNLKWYYWAAKLKSAMHYFSAALFSASMTIEQISASGLLLLAIFRVKKLNIQLVLKIEQTRNHFFYNYSLLLIVCTSTHWRPVLGKILKMRN